MLPLWLDLTERKVIIFGGGPVGCRKANYLAREADVVVVSHDFVEGFDPRVRLIEGDINGLLVQWTTWADLVVAATDDLSLNERIVQEARYQGKFSNRSDGISTFLIPSTVERDHYKVAVSTEGRSPGMSRYLRMEIDRVLDPRFDLMVELQEEIRARAKELVPSQKEREERLWDVLRDHSIWDLLESDPPQAMRLALQKLVS